MTDRLINPKPIYPLLGIITAIFIMVVGLLTAESIGSLYFLAAMWFLLLVFGYWRACLAVVPVAFVLSFVLAGITFLIAKDPLAVRAAVSRILAVCIAVIPGLSLSPILMVRNAAALKLPRTLTLAMMISLSFPHLLSREVKQVREALRTRGAGSIWNPRILYRAFLIPLIVRLVNISDTLSVSVETRGFTTDPATTYSQYKTVEFKHRDLVFIVSTLLVTGLAVFL